jgi:quercetin dioxygenase-like cupin family protein
MSQKTLEETVQRKESYREILRDYYSEFQKDEAIPVYTGFIFSDLEALELKPWARMGGSGAYVNLHGEELLGDNYLCEIPPGQSLKPQRHIYEELVYVLSGRGATTFWARDGGPKGTFEWKEHSLFALPANLGYQHFNGDESRPARFFAKTTLPAVFQYYKNRRFIFGNDFVFDEIEKEFYSAEAKIYKGRPPDYKIVWTANFIPDVRAFDQMTELQSRGEGKGVDFLFPGLVRLNAHMSEFPVGTYKKAHAHPPGRSIILITGKGYSILWQPGQEKEKTKVDWHAGSLFGVGLTSLQGECWYHQHFNSGADAARYLVLHVNSVVLRDKHVQIEYVDEEPDIRSLFENELAKSGVKGRMPPECYTNPKFKFKK